MTGPQTLTQTETDAMLEEINKHTGTPTKNRRAARNRLMFLLMLDAGLRVSETILMQISDLWLCDYARHSISIQTLKHKGDDARVIPLSDRIREAIALARAFYWMEHEVEIDAFAFSGRVPTRPLTARQAENIIGGIANTAIGRWTHPHILRHTFASRLMRTTNARVVQTLLGHKHLTSTQVYTHPNQDDLKKAIKSLSKGGD